MSSPPPTTLDYATAPTELPESPLARASSFICALSWVTVVLGLSINLIAICVLGVASGVLVGLPLAIAAMCQKNYAREPSKSALRRSLVFVLVCGLAVGVMVAIVVFT